MEVTLAAVILVVVHHIPPHLLHLHGQVVVHQVAAEVAAVGDAIFYGCLGVPLLWSGQAFRFNLLFVPHKRIFAAILNADILNISKYKLQF